VSAVSSCLTCVHRSIVASPRIARDGCIRKKRSLPASASAASASVLEPEPDPIAMTWGRPYEEAGIVDEEEQEELHEEDRDENEPPPAPRAPDQPSAPSTGLEPAGTELMPEDDDEQQEEEERAPVPGGRARRTSGGKSPARRSTHHLPSVPGAHRVVGPGDGSAEDQAAPPAGTGAGASDPPMRPQPEGSSDLVEAEVAVVVQPETVIATPVNEIETVAVEILEREECLPKFLLPKPAALVVAIVVLVAAIVGISLGLAWKNPPSSASAPAPSAFGDYASRSPSRASTPEQECQIEGDAFGLCTDTYAAESNATGACSLCMLDQERATTCTQAEYLACNLMDLCPSCGPCQATWLPYWNCLIPDYCGTLTCAAS
jgi:hypothetical protein